MKTPLQGDGGFGLLPSFGARIRLAAARSERSAPPAGVLQRPPYVYGGVARRCRLSRLNRSAPVLWELSGSQFSRHVGVAMSPFGPMSQFDFSQPALLHDRLNAKTFEWSPEWRTSFELYKRDAGLGIVAWDGLLLDRWAPIELVRTAAD